MRSVLALLLLLPAPALADVEIESESVYRSHDAPVLAEEDVVLQPFTQSFRLTAAERWEDSRVSFETHFRAIGESSARAPGFRESARVYYAYVDGQYGRRHPMDLRVGRQVQTAGGDLFAFDGVRFRYRGPLHFGVEAYGGATVSGFGAIVPIGVEDGGTTMAGGTAFGFAAFLTGVPGTQLRLGVRRVDRDGGVDREDVVMDFAHRLWRARIYGNGEFSTVLGSFHEGLLGTTYYAGRGTFTDLEVFHYEPSFGALSIFNVFHIEPYNELRFRVRSSLLAGRLGVWARVGTTAYGGGETAQNFSTGVSSAVTDNLFVSTRAFFAGGYMGSRAGGSADVRYVMFDDRVAVLVGGTVARAENDLLSTANGTFLSALFGASWSIPDRAELSLMVEQLSDDFTSGEPRVSASFRFKFGAGSARRAALSNTQRRVTP